MNLNDFLKDNSLVYVTRDSERALGIPASAGFHIISNDTPGATSLPAEYLNHALLIKEKEELDTHELLTHEKTVQYISSLPNPHIVVFKNTLQIERICTQKKWKLINPDAALAKQIEEKISQVSWLSELADFLPPHEITTVKNLTWTDTPYIAQFNHGHTGESTLYIKNESDLLTIQQQFPDRDVRKTVFIDGPVFTSNNVVFNNNSDPTDHKVIHGNISYQITGLPPFTTLPFSTIGNDWGLPWNILTAEQRKSYTSMTEAIGQKMAQAGWKGLFGIDVKLDTKNGQLFLLEINARQPASTTLESFLQKNINPASPSLFELHMSALLNLPFDMYSQDSIVELHQGSQIIQRLTPSYADKTTSKTFDTTPLIHKNIRCITYHNTKPNSDFLRLQSTQSIMKGHNEFNELGHFILSVLS